MSLRLVSETLLAVESGLRPELERLFRDHSDMLYRTAYGMLGNRADAQDVVQTVFLELLRRDLPLDLARNPQGYLYRSAVNRSLDTIRSRKRFDQAAYEKALELASDETSAQTAEEEHRRLMEAVATLEAKDTEVLILRYVHEQSDAAIGKLLGVSRGTIAMRLFRARRRLRKLIGEWS